MSTGCSSSALFIRNLEFFKRTNPSHETPIAKQRHGTHHGCHRERRGHAFGNRRRVRLPNIKLANEKATDHTLQRHSSYSAWHRSGTNAVPASCKGAPRPTTGGASRNRTERTRRPSALRESSPARRRWTVPKTSRQPCLSTALGEDRNPETSGPEHRELLQRSARPVKTAIGTGPTLAPRIGTAENG